MSPAFPFLALAALAAGPVAPVAVEPAAARPPDAARVIDLALAGKSHAILRELTDGVGPRLAGSPGADAAVRWARGWLERHGFSPASSRCG